MAKVDSHVKAHFLVEGFPLETALRHLANDPANHPHIRELAKIAVTGGKNGDAANVPMALWSLHDALHEHKHPAKDWYNWMSAADKVGLDAHTYHVAQEEAARHNTDNAAFQARRGMPFDANSWTATPEYHLWLADHQMATTPAHLAEDSTLTRFRHRIAEVNPQSTPQEIDESIQRHAYRANSTWRRMHNNADEIGEQKVRDRAVGPYQEIKSLPPRLKSQEKATRYRRLFRRLLMSRRRKYQTGEGKPFKSISGETGFEHPYEGGIVRAIPRDQSLHVDYLGPRDASPGQQDQLNTLGPAKVRSIIRGLKAKYPNSKFLTGIRPGGRRAVLPMARQSRVLRFAKPTNGFLDALRQARSSNMLALHQTAKKVATDLGLNPTSVVSALHDAPHGSVPGVAQAIYGAGRPEAVHQLASWIGLNGNLPGVAVFHLRPNGPDSLWKVRVSGSGFDIRNHLDQAGLTNRILMPRRNGYDVLIPDRGNISSEAVKSFADQHGVPYEMSRGHFKTLGSAEQATARKTFRNQIAAGERQQMARRNAVVTHHPSHMTRFDVFNPEHLTSDVVGLAREVYGSNAEEDRQADLEHFLANPPSTTEEWIHGRLTGVDTREGDPRIYGNAYRMVVPSRVTPFGGDPEAPREILVPPRYDEHGKRVKARPSNPSYMPILADALQDAGFEDQPFLRALRSGEHDSHHGYLLRKIGQFMAYPNSQLEAERWEKSLPQQIALRKAVLKKEAEEAAYRKVHEQIVGKGSNLPLEMIERRQVGDMRVNPPPGVTFWRPAYSFRASFGKGWRPAQEKSGRKLTIKEMKAILEERKQQRREEKEKRRQQSQTPIETPNEQLEQTDASNSA